MIEARSAKRSTDLKGFPKMVVPNNYWFSFRKHPYISISPNNQKTYLEHTLLNVWFLLAPRAPNPPNHQGTPRVLGHHALAADPVLHRPPTSHSSGHWWPPSGQTMPVTGRSFWTAVLFQCTIPSHLCARPILCGNLSTCFLLGCTNQQQISRKLRGYVNL